MTAPTPLADRSGLRWPLQPLLDACGLRAEALARRIGVAGNAVTAARRDGLSDVQADHWAIRLGTHPVLVWGWAWIDDADRAQGRPAHVRVASGLRDQIEAGQLAPGEPLPSTKTLAARWGVGPSTVTKALAELLAEGLLTGGGRRGRPVSVAPALPGDAAGCAVCGRPVEAGDEHYPHRPHCPLAARGWCDCDQAAHPECCPTCAAGVA